MSMTLLRAVPRTMLASYFVASGIKAIRDPESLVPAAEPLADRVVPLVKEYAPEQVAGFVPEDTVTLVRVNGVAQVVGRRRPGHRQGPAARRVAAGRLSGAEHHRQAPLLEGARPRGAGAGPQPLPEERQPARRGAARLSDTEGKPSLAWRAQKGGEAIAKEARKASKKLTKSSGRVAGGASDLAESAVVSGAALVAARRRLFAKGAEAGGEAVEGSEGGGRQAAEEAQEAAAKAAKQAKKEATEAGQGRQAKKAKESRRERPSSARTDSPLTSCR